MNILLEYLIVFIGVLIVNYYFHKFNRNNLPKKVLTPELLYLKKIYKVNIKGINKDNLSKEKIEADFILVPSSLNEDILRIARERNLSVVVIRE